MNMDAELVLASDVEIVAVHRLSPKVKTGIEAEPDDHALTRRLSRAPSQIIDRDSAELLELFRSPIKIVDALLTFARRREQDAEQLLDEAYPLLFRLYNEKVLIPGSSGDDDDGPARLAVGGLLGGFRLLRCIQLLDDSEVFLGRDATGRYAAVKSCQEEHADAFAAIEHEAVILQRVGRRSSPAVLSVIRGDGRISLITEWIFGLDAANAAAGLRGRREPRNEARLLDLCASIAATYADVHASGVLHGDVHPRNVIVQADGTVRLIDFGLAGQVGAAAPLAPRGGVAFYLDPEFATALLDGAGSAPLTAAAEQFSVAALLYEVWTGAHYAEWRLERAEMLRQIVGQPPAPFSSQGLRPRLELEAVLTKALQKRAEDRYADMAEFSAVLRQFASVEPPTGPVAAAGVSGEQALLDRSLRRYELGGVAIRDGLTETPLASVNYGAAGIAYALYRIAQHRGDPRLLAAADVWTERALTLSSHDKAFYDVDREIRPETVGAASLFHSDAGVHCVRALVRIAFGDAGGSQRAIMAYLAASSRPCDFSDLTLGRAGQLVGLAEITEALPSRWLVELASVRSRGDEIAGELLPLLKSNAIATSTGITSLGLAHGWGGILLALLRWARATGSQPDAAVIAGLDELGSLAEPHGGGLRWAVHNTTAAPTFMDSWCNGTAGHIMLFALAKEVLGTHGYAEIAGQAAESAWITDAQLGTLCCGTAGVAYGLLAAHRLTGEGKWVDRARLLTRRAAANGLSDHFLRDSLYKGALGVSLLAEELTNPATAGMPLCERAGVAGR